VIERGSAGEVITVPLEATCEEVGSARVRSGDVGGAFAPDLIVDTVTLRADRPARRIRVTHDGVSDVPLAHGETTELFRGTKPDAPWQADLERLPTDGGQFCTPVPPDDVRHVPLSERNQPAPQVDRSGNRER
jgi:hypothetical protein